MSTLQRKTRGNHDFWKGTLNKQLVEVLKQVKSELPQIERLSFVLYDHDTSLLKTYADSSHSYEDTFHRYECTLDKLPSLKECADNHCNRKISDFDHELEHPTTHNQWLKKQGFKSSYASPTYLNNKLIGFIFINANRPDFFENDVCEYLFPYIHLVQQAATWEYEIINTIFHAANSIIGRQPRHVLQLKNHQKRMHYYSTVIANSVSSIYKLNDEDVENIILFSRFHDIGKLSLSSNLLQKNSELTHVEKEKIRQHIEKGITIIDDIISKNGCYYHASLNILKNIISFHQEKLNGTGYPYGLKENNVPISARIINVANIFDALTSHRPYKQACSVPFALLELEKMVSQGEIDKHCVNALRQNQVFLSKIIQRFPEADPQDIAIRH